jgi:low temperature requirement protein LtrA
MHGMESQDSWSLSAALSAFQGMGIAFCFWWWYFDGAAGASERPIHTRREAMLFQIWNYVHWPLYTGIALAAVGVKHVVALAPGDRLHPMEAWILCGSVALAMGSVTVIGITSQAAQCSSCLSVQSFAHLSLASLTLFAGFVGHLVPPVLLITALTAVSVLQVGVSLGRKRVNQPAMEVVGDGVPVFGSEAVSKPGSGRGAKTRGSKAIHLFWPAALEVGEDSKIAQRSYF